MSVLEQQLKQMIRDHPRTRIHPHSPSGPHVRAVMWTADHLVLGQVIREKDGSWTVRAAHLPTGHDSLVVDHPTTQDAIPAAIDTVLSALATHH